MLDETQPSVSFFDIFHLSIRFHSEYLEGVKGLQWLDLADLVSSECPYEPEKHDKDNLDIEALAHPFLRVYLLSLLDHFLTTDALAIIRIIEFFVNFSSDHSLDDA